MIRNVLVLATAILLLLGSLPWLGASAAVSAQTDAEEQTDASGAAAATGDPLPLATAIPSRPGLDDPTAPTPRPLPTVSPNIRADTAPAPSSTRIMIDRPAVDAAMPQRFTATGWAIDPEGPGTGVDAVHVYLGGEAGRGIFLGAAQYGQERNDVGQQLGHMRYSLSGWSLPVELPVGQQTLYVHARRRGAETDAWSPPAVVEFTVEPSDGVSAVRALPITGTCPRAPDGTCLPRVSGPSPSCPVIGADGQCLQSGAGVTLPGVVGLPAATPGTVGGQGGTGQCVQRDTSGRCLAYASTPVPSEVPLVLRAETMSSMTTLQWTALPNAVTYELLRCTSAAGTGCSSLQVLSGTTYQVSRASNTWYVVHARGGNGQVIATSNVAAAP